MHWRWTTPKWFFQHRAFLPHSQYPVLFPSSPPLPWAPWPIKLQEPYVRDSPVSEMTPTSVLIHLTFHQSAIPWGKMERGREVGEETSAFSCLYCHSAFSFFHSWVVTLMTTLTFSSSALSSAQLLTMDLLGKKWKYNTQGSEGI